MTKIRNLNGETGTQNGDHGKTKTTAILHASGDDFTHQKNQAWAASIRHANVEDGKAESPTTSEMPFG